MDNLLSIKTSFAEALSDEMRLTYHEYYKPFALDLITSMSAIKKMYRPTSSEYRSVILNLHYYLIFGKILDFEFSVYVIRLLRV